MFKHLVPITSSLLVGLVAISINQIEALEDDITDLETFSTSLNIENPTEDEFKQLATKLLSRHHLDEDLVEVCQSSIDLLECDRETMKTFNILLEIQDIDPQSFNYLRAFRAKLFTECQGNLREDLIAQMDKISGSITDRVNSLTKMILDIKGYSYDKALLDDDFDLDAIAQGLLNYLISQGVDFAKLFNGKNKDKKFGIQFLNYIVNPCKDYHSKLHSTTMIYYEALKDRALMDKLSEQELKWYVMDATCTTISVMRPNIIFLCYESAKKQYKSKGNLGKAVTKILRG